MHNTVAILVQADHHDDCDHDIAYDDCDSSTVGVGDTRQ